MKQCFSWPILGLTSLLACLSAAQLQAQQTFSPGLLKLQVYRDIEGNTIDDLRADPRFPDSPDEVHFVTRFEIPASKYVAGNSGGIKVGEKLSGYLVPDQTANYVFYLSANESGELWLAKDPADPATLELIASGTANYPARTYDTNTPSGPIRLEAGKRYYVEALVKEGGKEESLAVAWTKENEPPPAFGAEPIPGRLLGLLTATDTTAPGAISNLAVDTASVGNSYLWLKWTAPTDPGSAEPVAHYELRYSTQPITAANFTSATLAETTFFFPAAPASSEIFKVEKLTPNTPYYFAVRAMDQAGNLAVLSNVASGKTKAVAAGDFAVVWDLEFDQAGADPTAQGDWKHRTANQTSFDPATQVAGGVLKAQSFNPTLDSAPKDNFTDDFIVELRMRCLTAVADTTMYDGVVFWVNLDTVDQKQARVAVALQLLADNTQRLNLVNKDTIITNFAGLSTDFQNIRLEFQPAFKKVLVKINGQDRGAFDYVQQETTDSRFATILAWNAEGEFDYVRIGRPLRQMDARWDLTFDQPGVDPTAKGDWKHRTPGQTSFDPATQVVDSVLKTTSFNPTLDTTPKDDFTYPFITETQMRCLTAVTEDKVYDGAVFWVNMDTTNGTHAAMTVSLQLMEDNTQRLNVINNGTVITNFTGLSTDFHTVRMEFDPPNLKFHLYLDGSDAGVMTYVKKAMNDDRYATVLSWGADAEFEYARIGTPVVATPTTLPSLSVTRSGSNVVLSWPASIIGFSLETTPGLLPANWSPVSGTPIVTGGLNTVTIAPSGSSGYYRLKQ
jgi:hypothetical protein